MQRDFFTYIDDIAEGTVRVLDKVDAPNPEYKNDQPNPSSSYAPVCVYNIANHTPAELMTFIKNIEDALGQEAKKNFLPMQNGDVVTTYANVEALRQNVEFEPKTHLTLGVVH